jgi:hypothetical protein
MRAEARAWSGDAPLPSWLRVGMTRRASSPHTARYTGMPRRPVSTRLTSARMAAPLAAKRAVTSATVAAGGRVLSWSVA